MNARVHWVRAPERDDTRFEVEIEITTSRSGGLRLLALRGPSWRFSPSIPLETRRMMEGVPWRFRLSAETSNVRELPLLEYEFDGHRSDRHLDISYEAFDLAERGKREGDPPPPRPRSERAGTLPEDRAIRMAPPGTRSAGARTIRVHGTMNYQRPDGAIVPVDGLEVTVLDRDPFVDPVIGGPVATDTEGRFDITVDWNPCGICEQNPDIYLRFRLINTQVKVVNNQFDVYEYESAEIDGYEGTDLDFGAFGPPSTLYARHHVLTDLVRTWRWFHGHGYTLPQVRAVYPFGTGASYVTGDIAIGSDLAWREEVHAHEYGHHFEHTFGAVAPPSYCNGICDAGECSHCLWCEENAPIPWDEGFAYWVGDVVTRWFAATGVAPFYSLDMEAVQPCGVDGQLADPTISEGHLAALMRDIEDAGNEHEPAYPGTWRDQLTLGSGELLAVVANDDPTTPLNFITRMRDRYPHLAEALWETARHNNYHPDVTGPGVVSDVGTQFVTACGGGTGLSRRFTWTRAPDDFSGTAGYSVVVSEGSVMPDAVAELGNVLTYQTSCLPHGSHVLNVRAVDRAGNWSPIYASYPFTVTTMVEVPMASPWALGVGACMAGAWGVWRIRGARRKAARRDIFQ